MNISSVFLVTGNAGKLAEWRRLLPPDISIESIDVDLPEIQSMDPEEIVADKAKRAFAVVGKPVIVEDVSAGLEVLNGLPGPFIKFFLKHMGDAALFTLAENKNKAAVVSCAIAYYDGINQVSVRGDVPGTVVSTRGNNGFGFDKTFVPSGSNKTYAEMEPNEKDAVSHRARAISLLLDALKTK